MEQQRIITTEKSISKIDMIKANEKFIQKYCKDKNWDVNNLTINQIIEITTDPGYRKN